VSSPSITRRLILTLTVGAAVLWLLGAIFTIAVLRSELERSLDGSLRETAERLLPLAVDSLVDDDDGDVDVPPLSYHPTMKETDGGEFVVYQVRDATGQVLMRSGDAPAEGFGTALSQGFTTVSPWRIFTTVDIATGLVIQVAESEARRNAALWGSVVALVLPLLLLVPLGALGIRLAVTNGLAPLRQLGQQVSRRGVVNLDPVTVSGEPTELRPMTTAVNGLLDRVRSAFEAERALAANSAHELRTPIAGSLAQTQRLVDELDGHPAQERARRVEDTLHRLSALAAKLLALSRADSGTALAARPIDLLPALRLIVDEAAASPDARGRVRLEIAEGAGLEAPIDIDAFGIVMRNLIENAVRHGSSATAIVVAVPNANIVEVTNAGAIVPAERLGQLTRRFERGDTSATGSGLGLAIVETIMIQVGGRVELFSPGIGRGDGFTVRLAFA